MTQSSPTRNSFGAARSGPPLPPKTLFGFMLALIAVLVIALLSYQSLQSTADSSRSLTRSIEILAQLNTVLSTVKDAETGQRGYLLTGEESYLEPFTTAKSALAGEFKALRGILSDRPEQTRRLDALQALAEQKMSELGKTVDLQHAGRAADALAVVHTGRGKIYMDRLRAAVAEMDGMERQLIAQRGQDWQTAAAVSLMVTLGGSAVLLVLIGFAAVVASRDFRKRQLESWLGAGQMGLSQQLQGDQTLDKLGNNLLEFLAAYLEAQVGAVYIAEAGQFRRFAGYALPMAATGGMDAVRAGDGLIGQAAKDNRAMHVRDVPAGYLPIASGLGQGAPGELLIAPASIDGVVHAVVEFGFFGNADPVKSQLLSRVSESIAVAVRASKDRHRLEELLQETQQQAEELQAGQEELRVSNEELEEQGRVLKESQAQMESQQAELEQINSQLEEQTHLLEGQKDALAKSHGRPHGEIDRAAARERIQERISGQHEPRAAYAAQFHADSRQAAGRQQGRQPDPAAGEIRPDHHLGGQRSAQPDQRRTGSVEDRGGQGRPGARGGIRGPHRGCAGENVSAGGGAEAAALLDHGGARRPRANRNRSAAPGADSQESAVECLEVHGAGRSRAAGFLRRAGQVGFAVRDTGVGIARHQQDVIFEAFRQADGSIHRKFGGTGLGLSISRDLAALLGGAIGVQSEPAAGSVFTLTLPVVYAAPAAGRFRLQQRAAASESAAAERAEPADRRQPMRWVRRRSRMTGNR